MEIPERDVGAKPLSPVAIFEKIIFPVADGIIDVAAVGAAVVDVPVALSYMETPLLALALATYAHSVTPFVFGIESKHLT